MRIKEYLRQKCMTVAELSRQLDYSRPFLTDVVNGRVGAGKRLAKAVELFTNGEVTVTELLNEYKDELEYENNPKKTLA